MAAKYKSKTNSQSQDRKINLKDKVLIDKDLQNECDETESYWQIEDKKELILNIEKLSGMWWKCVFKGDKEVNIEKIDAPQMSMDQLSEDARVTLDKMLYDQKAKELGLPTSEERIRRQNIEKLKKMVSREGFFIIK